MAHFELDVMSLDLRTQLDFFDVDDVLLLLRLPRFARLFVLVLPEIHETADRGPRRGRDLDQIEPAICCHGAGFVRRDNSKLFPVFVNKPDRADTNTIVDSWLFVHCTSFLVVTE